jgi:aminoglycoside phosphotransferase (APT) family kinase protein
VDVYAIHDLLSQLSNNVLTQPATIGSWQIMPMTGGTNNLLYRAIGPEGDVVIKWCIRDARQRAVREHAALSLLHDAQPGCAPAPIMVDTTRYHQPVVVQSYVPGAVYATPLETDKAWQPLIDCLVRIHRVQYRLDTPIQPAVINAHSVATARQLIQAQLDAIPLDAWPATLVALVRTLDATAIEELPAMPLVLCHVDSNYRNFVCTSDGVVAVDWENSGWGDPAFEIAELVAHPAYMSVSQSRWQWVIDAYSCTHDDPLAMRQRIATHLRIYRVWWVARFARYLYEVPRGRDQRLVARNSDWLHDMHAKYDRYLADAWCGLEG